LAWTQAHSRQGFARREQSVGFATLLAFGEADLIVLQGAYIPGDYDRVIEVPFTITSGGIEVQGRRSTLRNRSSKRLANYSCSDRKLGRRRTRRVHPTCAPDVRT
jgi:Competence protein J (ComJ)